MMMATRAPVERVIELAELSPAAPASVPSCAVMLPDWPCHESSVASGKYAEVCDMVVCFDWVSASLLVCVCMFLVMDINTQPGGLFEKSKYRTRYLQMGSQQNKNKTTTSKSSTNGPEITAP